RYPTDLPWSKHWKGVNNHIGRDRAQSSALKPSWLCGVPVPQVIVDAPTDAVKLHAIHNFMAICQTPCFLDWQEVTFKLLNLHGYYEIILGPTHTNPRQGLAINKQTPGC